jgi:predicted transcriptional regulator
MKKITIATRILPDWHREINQIMVATGKTQSQVMEEAIALYLKKATRLRVVSRLDEIEESLSNLRAIVLAAAS